MVYSRTVGESPDIGAHLIDLELDYDIVVFVARPRARRQSRQLRSVVSLGELLVADASGRRTAPTGGGAVASTGGCAAPISPLGPGETRKPRPNDSAIVRAVAAQFPGALAQLLPGTRRLVGIHGSHR